MTERNKTLVGGLAASETAGALGLQVAYFLVPLAAVQLFDASPLEIGVLNLVDSVAALTVGIAAGHWIDRVGGVRAMATANVLRFAVLALLGLALVFTPQMWVLYVAMFCIGVASLTHDAGLTSAVLQLGTRSSHGLNRVNSLLRGSSVVSELAGPGIGGLLVAALGFAAGAGVGSVGFGLAAIAAALCLRRMRRRRGPTVDPSDDSLRGEGNAPRVLGGLRFIWQDHALRRLSLSSLQFNLFSAVFQAVFLIYCIRELHFDTAAVAVVAVTAGIGALIGTALAASAPVAAAQKTVYVCSLATPAFCVGAMMLASQTEGVVPLLLVASAQAVFSACMVVCVVLFNTIRQLKSPTHMAGQIAASERVLALVGEIPGAVIGGILGTVFVLVLPLAVASIGMLGAGLWLLTVPDWSDGVRAETAVDGAV
ncbi:MFS transporter [Curtobacterium sp. RRHDQ66]|uniref:MFS transporter n=1 Tax=Curtobacterium guangdongense TaxID=3413380 RepID=UPI003BEFA963